MLLIKFLIQVCFDSRLHNWFFEFTSTFYIVANFNPKLKSVALNSDLQDAPIKTILSKPSVFQKRQYGFEPNVYTTCPTNFIKATNMV